MAKSGIEFKARKWTSSPCIKKQFDVVALDHDNNKQHYSLDEVVLFSTEEEAQKHADELNSEVGLNLRMEYVRKFWPVDAGIE